MKKPGIETRVTILAIFIMAAVVISGFLLYRNLTQIVSSIHDRAVPDFKLIVLKDINLDLLAIENNIQLYTLTKDKRNLANYYSVKKRLESRLAIFSGLPGSENEKIYRNDSVQSLIEKKMLIWEEIRRIHTVKDDPREQFDELYSMLEKKEIDTVKVEVTVEPEKKKGFFKKIFGKKDTATTRIDTSFVERTVENQEIKEEIESLEESLKQKEQKKNKRELQLIEQNIEITAELNKLIASIEEAEKENLIRETEEADQLATHVYKRLSAFSIMAVALLFVIIYLFVRYLQKAKVYKRVLTEAKYEAEKLTKAKEVFIANVSHEMRTPVNAIYGLTEQILQLQISKKVKEHLTVVLKSAQHLKEVVNDTLDFSKIQAKKLKLEEVDFSPGDAFNEVLSLHQSQAAAKSIDLIYKCKNELPNALRGDPFRLKQILINTIGNAIKFTESGGVTFLVESEIISDKLVHLHFQIKDTGIGISKENLDLIFEDFVQVEADNTRKFSGTGLGLSIVKKLVEMHDGQLSIKSELEQGTIVSFHIPYSVGNPKNIKVYKQTEIKIPASFRKLKLLVVDDEEFNRYLLKIIFDRWGVSFEEAGNGKIAVEKALEKEYDLILMDLRMPVLNGVEATKQILKKKPDSAILAVAAVNGEAEKQLCSEVGICNFLSKPFSESDLFDAMVSSLKTRKKEESENSDDYDLEELKRMANGDQEFMKEMIRIFIRSTRGELENIRQALIDKNWQKISDAAHKMAAPCKHIMANDLYAEIKLLENAAGTGKSFDQLQDLASSVEQKIIRINLSLENRIKHSDSVL